jgi:hypothetical protein
MKTHQQAPEYHHGERVCPRDSPVRFGHNRTIHRAGRQ